MRMIIEENSLEINIIVSVLRSIEREMERLYWNKYQKELNSPFNNTGEIYENKTFKVRAYDWNNDNIEPNFEYKGLKVWWYKHLGRGDYAEINTELSLKYLSNMLDDCIKSLKKYYGE